MPIRVLDAGTISKIAAGEVVERPASVLKELVENSIDAGARHITVEIRAGGIDYIRITDDGGGIPPEQVRLAFENHATSKLKEVKDLVEVSTMGFRGEALPSIAAVSKVELTTRTRGADIGTKITLEGGRVLDVTPIGCPDGTTVHVKELFFNLPARRAFLKKPGSEAGACIDTMMRLALGNTHVAFRMTSNGKLAFRTQGDGVLRHAIMAAYDRQTAENMHEVEGSVGALHISGLIGVGSCAKASRSHQHFFVNGRAIRCPMLSQALESACRGRVLIGRFPMCALNIELPQNAVDVNVHPGKLEVRFRDEAGLFTAAGLLLEQALSGDGMYTAEKPAESVNKPEIVVVGASEAGLQTFPSSEKAVQVNPNMPAQDSPMPENAAPGGLDTGAMRIARGEPDVRIDKPIIAPAKEVLQGIARPERVGAQTTTGAPQSGNLRMREQISTVSVSTASASTTPASAAQTSAAPSSEIAAPPQKAPNITANGAVKAPMQTVNPQTKQAQPPAPATLMEAAGIETPQVNFAENRQVIGTAFSTYIFVQSGDTLYVIDQHAAHERLLYEKFMRQWENGVVSQMLLVPYTLNVSAAEKAQIMENRELLSEIGFEIDDFGDRDIQVRAVPQIMGEPDLRPFFMLSVAELKRLKNAPLATRRDAVMQAACKHAVKGGDNLSSAEIEALLEQMRISGAPPTCPHGRPIIIAMPRTEFEKRFSRIV